MDILTDHHCCFFKTIPKKRREKKQTKPHFQRDKTQQNPHPQIFNKMTQLIMHHPLLKPSCSMIKSTTMSSSLCNSCSINWISQASLNSFKAILAKKTTRFSGVVCMANPRRVKMVAKQIMRELSDMLLTDNVLQCAILPEASLGADRYLSSLTTISDVELSADLQVVKVYVSVFGDERGKEVAITGLKSKAKYVRSMLGKRMKLRMTPEIRFIEDESLERGSRVIAILDKIKDEKSDPGSEKEGEGEESDVNQDGSDWEDDDDEPDDGQDVIYVK